MTRIPKKRGGYSVKFAGKEAAGNLRNRKNTLVAPSVSYTAKDSDFSTIVIWDPDAPDPSFVHWLLINIPGANVEAGEEIISYFPPSPPSGTHRYFVGLYTQPNRIQVELVPQTGFSIDEFIQKYGLVESGVKMIQVQHQS